MALTGLSDDVGVRRGSGEPWRKLVVHRDQPPRLAKWLQGKEKVVHLLVGRGTRHAVLALVPGQRLVGLDVEAEAGRRAPQPAVDNLRLGDAVEGGVDLDDGEEARVIAQLVALSRALLQLGRVELFVVGPVAGADEDLGRHRLTSHHSPPAAPTWPQPPPAPSSVVPLARPPHFPPRPP